MTESPAERLRRARIEKGFKTAKAAVEYYGWVESTYDAHENGGRGISKKAARRYAQAYGLSVAQLLGMPDGTIGPTATSDVPEVGEAALGVWHDQAVKQEAKAKKRVSLPPSKKGTGERRAVRIADNSANKKFQMGDYAIVVDPPSSFEDGQIVLVERRRGDLVETTVRQIVHDKAGRIRLATMSTNSKLKHELSYPSEGEDVQIVGHIIGRYTEF